MHGRRGSKESLKVNAVIFDWSGTTVDYGCMAPAIAFENIFKNCGIEISIKQLRSFMGLPKRDHILRMLQSDDVINKWMEKFNRKPDTKDLDNLYNAFEPQLFAILEKYSKPIPGVSSLVKDLKYAGLKIGSTTGYTKEMMKIVLKEAKKYSYEPDCIVTPEDAGGGRPMPWMCYLNLIELKVYPVSTVVKVGDTISDIREGINAGMWSIGVIKGSNELGLSEDEIIDIDKKKLKTLMNEVRSNYIANGAHYVIEEINELKGLIEIINNRLSKRKGNDYYGRFN